MVNMSKIIWLEILSAGQYVTTKWLRERLQISLKDSNQFTTSIANAVFQGQLTRRIVKGSKPTYAVTPTSSLPHKLTVGEVQAALAKSMEPPDDQAAEHF